MSLMRLFLIENGNFKMENWLLAVSYQQLVENFSFQFSIFNSKKSR